MREHFLINGRPTITCMIQARTPERASELIKEGIDGGADAFGLQLEQLERQYHNKEVYDELQKQMGDKPCYVTNYAYGTNQGISYDVLASELIAIAECGAKLIDISGDMFCASENQITYDDTAIEKQKVLIDKLHAIGTEVLISSHTYKYMTYEKVSSIARTQFDRGADLAKIVTAANTDSELQDAMQTTLKLMNDFAKPCLYLCVGDRSFKHRRIAPFLCNGIFLCVAEYDELATKAQPLLHDAKKLVNTLTSPFAFPC